MLYNEIIRLAPIKDTCEIAKPLVGKMRIHRIHDCYLLVKNHVRIIGHAIWHLVLAFKQVNLMVIDTYVFDAVCNFHMTLLLLFSFAG